MVELYSDVISESVSSPSRIKNYLVIFGCPRSDYALIISFKKRVQGKTKDSELRGDKNVQVLMKYC
jgi:hypothetical protein